MEEYNHRGNRILPPHVFVVADAAYKSMQLDNCDQAILVSGESGAGYFFNISKREEESKFRVVVVILLLLTSFDLFRQNRSNKTLLEFFG